MANFDLVIPMILNDEGDEFINDPLDLGGATKYGISYKFLKKVQPEATIKTVELLTREQAIYLYRIHFWEFYELDKLNDIKIASVCMELFVNMSPQSAAIVIQRAINDYNLCNNIMVNDTCHNLIVDGIFGTKSKTALQQVSCFGDSRFLPYLKLSQIKHYCDEVDKKPNQLKFLKGWVLRALR